MGDFTMSMMVGSYIDERPRMEEIIFTLERNLQNPIISDMHIFIEEALDRYYATLNEAPFEAIKKLDGLLRNPKVTVVKFGRRPLYSDYFEYANKTFPEGRIVGISNSDIEYDETLKLVGDYDLTNVFICLSREFGKGCHRAAVSQDTWIWKSPLRIFKSDWTLGLPGGDNRIAYEGKQGGYRVINPCLSINSKHHHTSRVRHWTHADRSKCAGTYMEVNPCGIQAIPRKAQG